MGTMGTMHASPFTFTIQFILQLVHCKLDTSLCMLLKIAQQYNFRMLFTYKQKEKNWQSKSTTTYLFLNYTKFCNENLPEKFDLRTSVFDT